jgi:hypothetical protein
MEVFEFRNTPNAVLAIELPVSGCGFTLNNLKCGSRNHFGIEFDTTLTMFAVANAIKSKLTGDPVKASKYKIANMCCNFFNKSFIMSFTTAPNPTALKKIASVVSKNLNPNKMGAKYSALVRAMGEVPDMNAFGNACKEINEAIGKMKISVSGRIKSDKVKEALAKVPKPNIEKYTGASGKRTNDLKNTLSGDALHRISDYTGIDVFIMKNYIEGHGVKVANCGNVLFVDIAMAKKVNLDKDRVKKYYDSIKKNKDHVAMLKHQLLSECFATQDQLTNLKF